MAEKKAKKKNASGTKKKLSPSDEIAPERRLKLEEGVERVFDMPAQMAEEVSSLFSFEKLAKNLAGKDEDEARAVYSKFGMDVMKKVIKLADDKYMDRTGEMIELVAKQTGVGFPHRVQRYAELSVLSLRAGDKCNVTMATTKEMRIQEYSCAMNKALTDAGIDLKGLPCGASCIGGFIEAARKTLTKMRILHTAKLPDDGYCEFTFLPLV